MSGVMNTTCQSTSFSSGPIWHFYVGLILAILSCFIMAWSYIVKKLSLNRLMVRGKRAGDGGFGYLKDWMWWTGLLLMGSGELINSVAYGFAPASLVTPLGALSVLFTAIFSSRILNEHLNLIGRIGCGVCLCGSITIVVLAPKEQVINSLEELTKRYMSYGFLIYFFFIVLMVVILLTAFAPRYGKRNPAIFLLVSSSIGSLSVMSVKGIGVCVKDIIGGVHVWENWIAYFIIVVLVVGLMVQVNYLNKALDLFNANIVTPLIYVFFTTFVIIASSILLEEWSALRFENCLGMVMGFISIIFGFLLLYLFKDLNITWSEMKTDLLQSMYRESQAQSQIRQNSAEILRETHTYGSDDDNVPFLDNDVKNC